MNDVQITELIESPFTKVNKGLEVVGDWQRNLRKLVDGSAEEEIRCACYFFINKKTPKLKSDIMTDHVTRVAENVIFAIQQMANEMFGINAPVVVE